MSDALLHELAPDANGVDVFSVGVDLAVLSPSCDAGALPSFQPSPHLIEGMMVIQKGEPQGFDATPTREPMRRVGRDEALNDSGNLQTP